MSTPTIEVDAAALRQVLQALVGQPHEIRELQATRSLHALGHTNAIETLLAQFNAWATQPVGSRDAAFEAVRKAFCKLQRYSFFLDGAGNVRRCADHCGNWVEFDAVHTLFEPQSVDAALAAQAKQGGA